MSLEKPILTALLGVIAAMLLASPALAANAKTVYAQKAQIEHEVGDPYTGAIDGTLSSGTAKFSLAGGTSISCNQSTKNGTITDSGAGDGVVDGVVETMAFANNGEACPWNGGGNCTITANNLAWNFTITIPGATAVQTISKARFTINCGFANCVYATESLVGAVSWNPAGISFNQSIPRVEGGFLCPSTATLEAVYSELGQDDVGEAIGIQVWSF